MLKLRLCLSGPVQRVLKRLNWCGVYVAKWRETHCRLHVLALTLPSECRLNATQTSTQPLQTALQNPQNGMADPPHLMLHSRLSPRTSQISSSCLLHLAKKMVPASWFLLRNSIDATGASSTFFTIFLTKDAKWPTRKVNSVFLLISHIKPCGHILENKMNNKYYM
jgi:hypothetical protein